MVKVDLDILVKLDDSNLMILDQIVLGLCDPHCVRNDRTNEQQGLRELMEISVSLEM